MLTRVGHLGLVTGEISRTGEQLGNFRGRSPTSPSSAGPSTSPTLGAEPSP
jgi:hypothetical protein